MPVRPGSIEGRLVRGGGSVAQRVGGVGVGLGVGGSTMTYIDSSHSSSRLLSTFSATALCTTFHHTAVSGQYILSSVPGVVH